MSDHSDNMPIIIKRSKRRRHGHHGGAWKVAFADFAIAMMAFFLVLWLSEAATETQKAAISGYFDDPVAFNDRASVFVIDMEGAALQKEEGQSKENQDDPNDLNRISTKEELKGLISAEAVQSLAQQIEQQRFDQLMKEMQTRINQSAELSEYKDQILMSVTPEGLLIQIVDKKSRPMFDSGSARLKPYIYIILRGVADLINSIPNKISISGHTDAIEFEGRRNFTNWELSSERANAARRALVQSGMDGQQVAEVVGLASSQLLDRDKPDDPINRRISILALSKKSQAQLDQRLGGETINSDGEKVTISTAEKTPPVRKLPEAEEPEIEVPEIELSQQEPEERIDQRPTPEVDVVPEKPNSSNKEDATRPTISREGWKKILPTRGETQPRTGSGGATTNKPPAEDDSDELF